jgi:type I restriction enzyme, S subunit
VSWNFGKVSDIGDVISGFAFKSTWFGEGSAKVIRIGDLKDGLIEIDGAVSFDSSQHRVKEQFKIKNGDILMALSGATVGKIAVADSSVEGAYLNQRVAIIRGRKPEHCKYLKHVFSGSLLQKLLMNAGGAAQPNLSPKDLASMEIPLPPLAEQKRIASILDKADAICRKRQQAIELADEFLRAVFLDMFGDPVTNPKNFPVGTIRDLVEAANYGSSAKASEVDGEYPILRMGNITYSGAIDMTDLKYIDLSEKDKPKYLVTKGDLLFNRTNSKELVGKTAVYDGDNPVAIAGYLIRVRTNGTGNTHYISGYLNSTHGKVTLQNICKSIVGMANINAQEMQDIPILIPPVDLQNKYRDIVLSVKEKLTKHQTALTFNSDLFGSLSQKAFSGDL